MSQLVACVMRVMRLGSVAEVERPTYVVTIGLVLP
jgi:hypothetical protein